MAIGLVFSLINIEKLSISSKCYFQIIADLVAISCCLLLFFAISYSYGIVLRCLQSKVTKFSVSILNLPLQKSNLI